MIIDSHNHIGKRKGINFTAEEMIEWLDKAGVDACVVTSQVETINNDYVADMQKKYPDRIIGYAVVNPWEWEAEEELERCFRDLNLYGLKLNPVRHGFDLDRHEIVDPLFKICEKYNKPVLVHGQSDMFNMPGKFDEMAEADNEVTGGYAYPYFWRKPLLDAAWVPAEMINVDGNKIFWRLAEIYLLRAEARCRANLPGAEDDLNYVRNRAHAKIYPADTDTEGLQMAIFREREREMFFDGERYYDIVRNGYYNFPGMISETFEKLSEQDVKDGALYVPIMDTEMQRNTLMRQNPYWLARW